MVETVEAGGNGTKNPFGQKNSISVVQVSVEVTESSRNYVTYIQVVARDRFN
jgi:hypothetical protein